MFGERSQLRPVDQREDASSTARRRRIGVAGFDTPTRSEAGPRDVHHIVDGARTTRLEHERPGEQSATELGQVRHHAASTPDLTLDHHRQRPVASTPDGRHIDAYPPDRQSTTSPAPATAGMAAPSAARQAEATGPTSTSRAPADSR